MASPTATIHIYLDFSATSMDSEFPTPLRSVKKLTPLDSYLSGSWEALGAGAPMLVALSQLCSDAIVNYPSVVAADANRDNSRGNASEDELSTLRNRLSPEAKAILVSSRNRGVIELKAINTAFEAPSRLLAVYVEVDDVQTIAFRDPHNPEITVRFLEGFRQLCSLGLVMHHIYHDFSLTSRGFDLARTITQEEIQPWIDKGTEFGLHD